MTTTFAPQAGAWRSLCDLVCAANVLPAEAIANGVGAELHNELAAFAQSSDDLYALTFCNPEVLLDLLATTRFLALVAPNSVLHERFRGTVSRALTYRVQWGTEVAAHYATACDSYLAALGFPPGSSPYVAAHEAAFGRPFWLVRPRAVCDRSDYRRALYASVLSQNRMRADITALLGFELADTVRAGDAEQTAWLLVAWTGETALERALLPAALRLVQREPPEARLDHLVRANLRIRSGKELQ